MTYRLYLNVGKNYQSTLRNIPEERRPHLQGAGSLKMRIYFNCRLIIIIINIIINSIVRAGAVMMITIIIIIIINCIYVVTRWQCLFYMYTKYEIGY